MMLSIKTFRHAAIGLLLGLGMVRPAGAQSDEEAYGNGISLTFGEHNRLKLQVMSWHQVWLRGIENNPGTIVDGNTDSWTADIMLRRSRLLMMFEVSSSVLMVMHFGINNQTFTNGGAGTDGFRPQLYIHDAMAEVTVLPEYLSIGAGLTYWNGISRLTNASTVSLLGLDAPIVNWPTLDLTDQFARQLGVYAKGEIGQFHYRTALTRPFNRDVAAFVAPEAAEQVSAFNASANSFALKAYFDFAFLDKESHKLPYYTGTYLGNKSVFNLGTGFDWQPNAMLHCNAEPVNDVCPEEQQRESDLFLFGADAFLDLPIGLSAITSYLAYYYQDFGPDMQRTLGVANLASNGAYEGNAYPNIGTGHHLYGQLGYLLPFRPFGDKKISTYGTLQVSMLDGKDDPSIITEVGAKYYLIGHYSSLTFNWRNRPLFLEQQSELFVPSRTVQGRASELILQLQVWL